MDPNPREERKSGGARNGPAGIYGVINNTASEELELPVLYFAEGQEDLQTNIMDCKELRSIYLKRTYGYAGRLLDLGKHYEPEPVKRPTIPNGASDEEKAIVMNLYREDCKIRLREIAEMKRAYAKIYAFLYGQLSEESKEKVKTVQNWDDIEESNDPLDLWKAIVATHMAAVTGATACDKSRARSAYSNINQDSTESVASLKKRIDNALKVYDAVGQSRPADEELAADFIRQLDTNRFAGLRADLENKQLIYGQDMYPKTLVDAYSMAVNYKVIVPISDN